MRIEVRSHILDLKTDLESIPERAPADLSRAVRETAVEGNRLAAVFARKSAGRHGVHYPDAITVEQRGPYRYEYGPDSSMPQGGMEFEWGSRNQPAHLDLNRSADIIGPKLADRVDRALQGLFW